MCYCKAKLFDEDKLIYSYVFDRERPRFFDGNVEIPAVPIHGCIDTVTPSGGYAIYDDLAKKVRFGCKPVNEITIK